jgi:hypothetical protein
MTDKTKGAGYGDHYIEPCGIFRSVIATPPVMSPQNEILFRQMMGDSLAGQPHPDMIKADAGKFKG